MFLIEVLIIFVIEMILILFVENQSEAEYKKMITKDKREDYDNNKELCDIIRKELEKEKFAYLVDHEIKDNILRIDYMYIGDDDEKERYEKVMKKVSESCNFYGPLLGINISNIELNIKRLDINKTIET